jgi:hypothetical protein
MATLREGTARAQKRQDSENNIYLKYLYLCTYNLDVNTVLTAHCFRFAGRQKGQWIRGGAAPSAAQEQ